MPFSVDAKPEPIESVLQAIDDVLKLAGLSGSIDNWALLGFPEHSNVGDSAIWLGSVKILERTFGQRPSYVGTETEFPSKIQSVMPNGPIFLIGGGNFGDIWPKFHESRLKLLKSFPNRKIVQLPQTIHYSSPELLKEMRVAIANHPDFTLFVRDESSLRFAQENFDCPTFLCPDMAYGIGRLFAKRQASDEVFSLMRTDREALIAGDEGDRLRELGEIGDWVENKWRFPRQDKLLLSASTRSEFLKSALMRYKERIFYRKAEAEVLRGVELLSRGRLVVTDRLHAHILCVLMGKPHVVLDNSYGKVFNYISTWRDDGVTTRVNTIDEAFRQVARLQSQDDNTAAPL